MKVLAGDVGGTHARLAIVEIDDADREVLEEREYDSREFDGLAPIVRRFRTEIGTVVEAASFGLACPISEGVCRLTNLDWEIDVASFGDEIGIAHTRIVNDFNCVGHALRFLGADDRVELQPGKPREHGPIAVIGAGTGLGQGFLVWRDGRYRVHASEGGHVDLAARSAVGWELKQHLQEKYGHVSYERVVSGPGLVDVYDFLVESGYEEERAETRSAMAERDAAAVISEFGLARDDPACARALDIFVELFGAQAGNLALTVRADGGVYIAGGIAPQIIDRLRNGPFLEAFRSKGRMSDLVAAVPVWVIVNPQIGLIGAAAAVLPE
jgi:glucokinase